MSSTEPAEQVGGAVRLLGDLSSEEQDEAWRVVEELSTRHESARRLKRLVDLPVAMTCLAVASPSLGVLSALLALSLRESPLLVQRRAGHLGRPFGLLKLKTMRTLVDDEGRLLPNHLRTPLVGRLVRKSGLDELPQLLNVIAGDISIVGPRPLWPEYVPCYTATELQRLSQRPGLTGLAQIHGRVSVEWATRFALDVDYCRRPGLRRDAAILLGTIRELMRPTNATSADSKSLIADRRGAPFTPPIGFDPESVPSEWMAPSVAVDRGSTGPLGRVRRAVRVASSVISRGLRTVS